MNLHTCGYHENYDPRPLPSSDLEEVGQKEGRTFKRISQSIPEGSYISCRETSFRKGMRRVHYSECIFQPEEKKRAIERAFKMMEQTKQIKDIDEDIRPYVKQVPSYLRLLPPGISEKLIEKFYFDKSDTKYYIDGKEQN